MPEELPGALSEWIGRSSRSQETISERNGANFRAVLEPYLAPVPEGTMPVGLHWCLCRTMPRMDEIGPDGQPARNGELPPVPLPRRMWAGGQVETFDALRVGDVVTRRSTIAGIERKLGKSGELWFVTMMHDYSTARGPAIRERQDLVYREAARPQDAGAGAAPGALAPQRSQSRAWSLLVTPVLLFRYSAITLNSHRIHYDQPYATTVEGYRGLVLHGPLQATLLLNLATTETGHTPGRFKYRCLAPAFAGDEIGVCGADGGHYRIECGGHIHTEATVWP